jgi:O-antigen/teichoic acid export membrane protein
VTAEPVRPSSRIAAHAAVTFVGLMTANVLGYVLYALLSRVLGVVAYGTLSSLLAIVQIVITPALIAQMVTAKLAAGMAHDPSRLAGLVRAIDGFAVRAALAATLALAALAVPIASFLHIPDPMLIVLTALSLCGAVALPFVRGILQGMSSFTAFALSNVLEAFGKALAGPLLGLVAGLRGALSGLAIGYAVAAVYTLVAARAHGRGERVALSLRSVALTSLGVAGGVFFINLLLFYDVVLAKRYLDPHTVGLYGAAALSSRALYAVTAFIPTVLLPQAANRSALGHRTRWLFAQALGLTAAICVAVFVLYALAPRWVITTITGRAFAGGAPFLVPYVVATSALALANVVATYNIARGRLRFVVPLALVALGEIVAVVLRHRSAADLLQTIAVGHTLALLACATSLGGRSRAEPDRAQRSAA